MFQRLQRLVRNDEDGRPTQRERDRVPRIGQRLADVRIVHRRQANVHGDAGPGLVRAGRAATQDNGTVQKVSDRHVLAGHGRDARGHRRLVTAVRAARGTLARSRAAVRDAVPVVRRRRIAVHRHHAPFARGP